MQKFDFESLNKFLCQDIKSILSEWFPNGKPTRSSFIMGDINGNKGTSLLVDLRNNGHWKDLNTGECGGDLISLYAAHHRISNGEAYIALASQYNFDIVQDSTPVKGVKKSRRVIGRPLTSPAAIDLVKPPSDTLFTPKVKGDFDTYYTYTNELGEPLFYIHRKDPEPDSDQKKKFTPWSYSQSAQKFVAKMWPSHRPLYNLAELTKYPDRPVLVVEGENCVRDATILLGDKYVCTTWHGGAQAASKSDWSPLFKRSKIILWPDADMAGLSAMNSIAEILYKAGHSSIYIINTTSLFETKPKWDVSDALKEGMTHDSWRDWALPLIKQFQPIPTELIPTQTESPIEINNLPAELPIDKLPSAEYIADSLGLQLTKQGLQGNVDTISTILTRLACFKNRLHYDEFYRRIRTTLSITDNILSECPEYNWSDANDTALLKFFQSRLGIKSLSIDTIRLATRWAAKQSTVYAPRDYITNLKWDAVTRVDQFFQRYYGAEDSEYTRAVSKNFWVSLVARIMKPGCKADCMVILEGVQGSKKSSSLEAIAGSEWFAEATYDIGDKDFNMSLAGKIIVEIGELDAFRKAENNTIKKILSCRVDRYRQPYAREPEDYPRCGIFVGTTNADTYLTDETGSRRFWPIATATIDLDGIKRDRDQLYAEAFQLYKSGANWHEVPQDEIELIHSERFDEDTWTSDIKLFIKKRSLNWRADPLTTKEIAFSVFKIELANLKRDTANRISKIMRRLNWVLKPQRINSSVTKGWRPNWDHPTLIIDNEVTKGVTSGTEEDF